MKLVTAFDHAKPLNSKGEGVMQLHAADCSHLRRRPTTEGSLTVQGAPYTLTTAEELADYMAYIIRVVDGSQDDPDGEVEFTWVFRELPCARKLIETL